MAYKHLSLKPWVPVSSKVLQSTIAAEVTQVAGFGHLNALHSKDLATQNYILCAQLLQINHEYCASLQASILSITGIWMLMYTSKLCVKCHSCEFFYCLDCEFLNQENFC